MRNPFVNDYYPPYEAGGHEQLSCDAALRLAERGNHIQKLTGVRGVRQGEIALRSSLYGVVNTFAKTGGTK